MSEETTKGADKIPWDEKFRENCCQIRMEQEKESRKLPVKLFLHGWKCPYCGAKLFTRANKKRSIQPEFYTELTTYRIFGCLTCNYRYATIKTDHWTDSAVRGRSYILIPNKKI